MERTGKSGDVIEIYFPMPPRITTGFNEFISIECGPLLFSKAIVDCWVKLAIGA